MLTCYYCSRKFKIISEILKHLQQTCPNFSYLDFPRVRCGELGCFRIYDSLHALRMHYKRVHGAVQTLVSPNNISFSDTSTSAKAITASAVQDAPTNDAVSTVRNENENVVTDNENTIPDVDRASTSSNCNYNTTQIQRACNNHNIESIFIRDLSLMISSLLSDPLIPRKTAQSLIKNMLVFLTNSLTLFLQSCYDNDIRKDVADIEGILDTISTSTAMFLTEYKREKYYTNIGTYISPQQYPLALNNFEFSRGLRKQVIGTGQFIQIRHVLTRFLSIPGVFSAIEEYINDCNRSSSIRNIVKSPRWLQISQSGNVNEKFYPLLLYYDEFETGNPLSSHAGIHKLGAMYTSIACLPPYLASKVKYIFLFALFHYSDRLTEEGNQAAFRVVIDELKYLSTIGITLDIPEFQGVIKFKLGALMGDNLGLHSILGFVESFSAKYPCRICKANKEQVQNMCFEDISLLRNEDNYFADVNSKNLSETGVRHKAIWYALDGFHLFEQVAVDMMHDILEGVVNYTMTLVINSLLLKKYFTLKELNNKAETFDYGPDTNNKPPLLSSENAFKIKWKMSAIESLNYVRYFSCLVSHKVPENDEHWRLYILLRRVLDFTMTDCVDTIVCDRLTWAVEEFNMLYLQLSSTPLKPKFHHLVHYPEIMKKLGPVHNLWSMRYESKHRVLKIAARSSMSRVNICKTLAIKNQLQLNNLFLENRLPSNFQHPCKIGKLDHSQLLILVEQFNLLPSTELCSATFVKINGVTYRPNNVLTLHIDEEYGDPVFFIISKIFLCLVSKKAFFEGYLLKTVTFDPHVHAYVVENKNDHHFVSYDSLIFVHPNTLSILPSLECSYIIMRNSLD